MGYGCPLNESFGGLKKKKKKDNTIPSLDNIYTNEGLEPELTTIEKKSIEVNPNESINPNEGINVNQLSKQIDEKIQTILNTMNKKIEDLSKQIEDTKSKPIYKLNPPLKETFSNVNNDDHSINNCNINELIMYIFTGIFLLLCMDYMYKLGKKSY